MLKLIEQDADSFAQRAEMYYKKRPELISMVEDFYRAHRSLAEQYDHVKSDHGPRLLANVGPPFNPVKHQPMKLTSFTGRSYDNYSVTSDVEEYAESEVDNPEHEIEIEEEIKKVEDSKLETEAKSDNKESKEKAVSIDATHADEIMKLREVIERLKEENKMRKDQEEAISSDVAHAADEIMKLKEEIERLKEENKRQKDQKQAVSLDATAHADEITKLKEEIARLKEGNKTQKDQLMQKDEEKREAIRQLSWAVGVLKDENVKLKKYIAEESPKKLNHFELCKLKGGFLGKLFSGSSRSQATVIPL